MDMSTFVSGAISLSRYSRYVSGESKVSFKSLSTLITKHNIDVEVFYSFTEWSLIFDNKNKKAS